MEGHIVHDHHVAFRQGRGQLGFDIDLEDVPVHGRVDDPGCHQAVTAQTGDEGLCFPVAKRRLGPVALPARCPAGAFGELGVGGGFINEHQPGQSPVEERRAPGDPEMAFPGNVSTPAFAGLQTFFYGSGQAGP